VTATRRESIAEIGATVCSPWHGGDRLVRISGGERELSEHRDSGESACRRLRARPYRPSFRYCLAIATRSRSSAVIRWSRSSAASSMSIWTQRTRPVNALSLGP